ncbi:flagellar basal body-associated FliL family protein [Oligoflexus tunisiensis]|uniref:flagellar basal body-associated FliL family protein n=1 Tax=Oligoflexus tunisiensis TaxID=708132 RepID=UPI00114CD0A9|nr:flagellar basal body-associated FliL family protein [Oligoflexus tunisiensis]
MAEEGKKDEKEKKEGEASAEENPEQEAKKNKKKLLIFAILGVLLIGGGGAGAFFFLSGGKKAGTDQEITAKGVAEKAGEHGADPKAEGGHEEGKGADPKAEGGHEGAKADAAGAAKDGDKAAAGNAEGGKKADGTAADKKDMKPQLDIDFGDTYKMATFNINLGNALENRYVRIEISLEYKGGDGTKQEIEKRMPQLRDAIIGILQRKTREFLLAPDGKEALRKEILTRINRYMKTKIEAVYITDMLIE